MDITRANLLTLIQNGLKQHGLSIARLEKDAGVPKDTVRDFLRAKTQILRADKLQKILRVLQPDDRLTLSGETNAQSELHPLAESAAKEFVDIPPGMNAGDVHAIRVKGDAMAPVFHDGWIIYYTTGSHTPLPVKSAPYVPYGKGESGEAYAAFLGKPCIIRLTDDRMLLRTLKPGKDGKYTLAAYSTPDITDASVKAVYKIVFIKPV